MCHCSFCTIVNNRNNKCLPYNKVIFENKNFIAIPALGQFIEGYLLIISKRHLTSMALLNSDEFQDLEKIKTEVSTKFKPYYGTPIFFEHGSTSGDSISGNSITHAHLHAVGTNICLISRLKDHFVMKKLTTYDDLKSLGRDEKSYLYYENTNGSKWSCIVDKKIPSQFLRKLLADAVGFRKDEWDWKIFAFHEKIEAFLKKMTIDS
jgi:diadenosine tetraphosphate (Ap4A) HIT family hydrolase